jgi:NADH-quinone oxidoreductase subunit M
MQDTAVATVGALDSFLSWLGNPITQVLMWPLLGCLLLWGISKHNLAALRWTALICALGSFGCSVLILTGVGKNAAGQGIALARDVQFFPLAQYEMPFSADEAAGMQYVQNVQWMSIKFGELQSFGVNYAVGVDSLSMPLVLLSTFILVCVVLWAWTRTDRLKEFLALTMFMQVGLLGSFVALDYVLLYLFWEWMLIPMFFLIAGWGKNPDRARSAAIKFFIYTLAGSVFMLIAFIAMQVWCRGNVYTFSIMDIGVYMQSLGYDSVPTSVRLLMFLGLLLGFAVKAPMWPFHTWLPDAHSEAPTEMSVILAALMLKSGTYAYLRMLYPSFPDIAYHAGPAIAFCGVMAIVYGAGITLQQTDLKRMVAYSSISHMGFVILGISSLNASGIAGAMFHMVGHGILIAMLFFLVGWIEQRYGTRDMRELAGLMQRSPVAGGLLTLGAFAGMGFPGLIAFWGELLTLQGTYFNNPQWFSVMLPAPATLLAFWSRLLSSANLFYDSSQWFFPGAPVGLSGARFLQACAVVAVLGILTSAIYMINMLLKVVFSAPVEGAAPDLIESPLGAVPALGPSLSGELALAVAPAPGAGALPAVARRPGRAPGALFGLEWNHALVLIPLAVCVVGLGLFPQPLLNIVNTWADVLAQAVLNY